MVAINSAIEVDLTGQVCADSIGPRLYSGVGGQVDFIYGASRSKGGKPIIALPSSATVKGQLVSKIVPMLKPGAGVVTTRNHVHYVVTEYGVADLYGKTIRQRATGADRRGPSPVPRGTGKGRARAEVPVSRSQVAGRTGPPRAGLFVLFHLTPVTGQLGTFVIDQDCAKGI